MNPTSTSSADAPSSRTAGSPDDGNAKAQAKDAAKVLLVVNRKARSGEADLAPAVAALANAFGPLETLDVEDPNQLAAQIERACGPQIHCVIVAGGDGTLNSALPVLLKIRKPVGILPLGTANDLARTLGISTSLEDAAGVIVGGRTRLIDVGVVNGRYFLNAAGIGFSTKLMDELPPWVKRTFGPLAYPIGVLRRWRRHRPFWALVHGNGVPVRRRVIQITVANGRFYGGGMTAEQDARIDDSRLDVVMVLPGSWRRHLLSVIGLKRGVYPEAAPVVVEHRTAFELTTRPIEQVATDGEPSTTTPASFGVLPDALEVYVP